MIKVVRSGTTDELFQLNVHQVPSIGDELLLEDEPYLVTGRRHVLETTQRPVKNVDYMIIYVQKAW